MSKNYASKILLIFFTYIGSVEAQTPVNQSGFLFVEEETPVGALNGVNTIFLLGQPPNPISSLAVFRNGMRLKRTLDYSLTGGQLTFYPAAVPQVGDVLLSSYRVIPSTASFVKTDSTTQGNWSGVYGAGGSAIAQISPLFPTYAQVNLNSTPNWTWTVPLSTDLRALTTGVSTNRLASAWGAFPTFSFDLNITDGRYHQFAIYCLDWENVPRTETIDILDASSNIVLSTQTLSAFSQGKYLVWNVSGHITVRVSAVSATNCVISGIFFGL